MRCSDQIQKRTEKFDLMRWQNWREFPFYKKKQKNKKNEQTIAVTSKIFIDWIFEWMEQISLWHINKNMLREQTECLSCQAPWTLTVLLTAGRAEANDKKQCLSIQDWVHQSLLQSPHHFKLSYYFYKCCFKSQSSEPPVAPNIRHLVLMYCRN